VGPGNPMRDTDSYITHRQSSLRVRYHQFNINPQKGGKPGSNETFQNKDIIAAVLCPIDDPSLQTPYIANYHIAGDFVVMVFEQILSKAGNLNLISIRAYSTGWEPAHNAHEFK
jgi:hypothetical protein